MKQAAIDERIQFWGRNFQYEIPEDIKESESLVKIKPSHFEDFSFDTTQLALSKNYDIFTRKIGYSPQQLKGQCFRDPHVHSAQAREWLKREGKPPPAASFHIKFAAYPSQIDNYDCVCAVVVKNLESNELKKCLVQMEQINFTCPNKMPMPLVLRTDGQIRNLRKGRFTLSPQQPKTVPVLFQSQTRRNEWYFFDEHGESYLSV